MKSATGDGASGAEPVVEGRAEPLGSTEADQTDATSAPRRERVAPRPAFSCTDDSTGDTEGSGSTPSYADLQRGCLREDGTTTAFGALTVGALPGRMPDRETHLAITFTVSRPSGPKTYVTAEATDRGWTATLTRGPHRVQLPVPSLDGRGLDISVPTAELGSEPRVEWQVESSWLRATLTSTDYAFDDAPNGGGSIAFDRD